MSLLILCQYKNLTSKYRKNILHLHLPVCCRTCTNLMCAVTPLMRTAIKYCSDFVQQC